MRLIDADELIKRLEDLAADPWNKKCGASRYLCDCADLVDDFPTAQQWIPVTKRLPEVRQRVLCQCRAGIQDVLRLTDDGDWECTYPHTIYMKSFVVAWMPLPEAYTGGDTDGT